MTIPYAKLGIPANLEKQLSGGAPLKLRLTLAKGCQLALSITLHCARYLSNQKKRDKQRPDRFNFIW